MFLCYKETDEAGERTVDSTLAQDICYQLTDEGYRVFFSRITLEDKLGREYEPHIFAALNSARVMLVIGTKPEHFNAVWVRNEWSRYLALMKGDRKRLLIPCYRDMDPYDLPDELSALQSQDMSKIGFMQDIIRGVKKVLDAGKAGKPDPKPAEATGGAVPGVELLLTRAQLFLEDGDWTSADEYAEKVLDIDPKCAAAYMVKVQARQKVRREAELGESTTSLALNRDFEKAMRFADEAQRERYSGYQRAVEKRQKEEKLAREYKAAAQAEGRATSESDYLAAAEMFRKLGGYRDAVRWVVHCNERAAEAKQKAEERRRREEQARIERERKAEQERMKAERQAERERAYAERKRKRNRTVGIIVAAVVVAAIATGMLYTQVLKPNGSYNAALKALDAGNYDEAIQLFEALGDYKDAAAQVWECQYQKGTTLLAEGEYDAATEVFMAIGGYLDATTLSKESQYRKAAALLEQGEYDEAASRFESISGYKDAAAQAQESRYQEGRSAVG